jgi:hypothetical protein
MGLNPYRGFESLSLRHPPSVISMKTLSVALALVGTACAPMSAISPSADMRESPATEVEVQELALAMGFMPGTFETFADPSVESDPTPVRIRHARFWPERRNEGWIYAEYSYQDDDAHPFRQRIYRVRPARGSSGVQLTVYEPRGGLSRFAGEWKRTRPFADLSLEDLHERAGCGIYLIRQMEMVLAGGTSGQGCRGSIPGVHHEHWEFQFTSSSMRTWEAGLDASGGQVSGPPAPWETRRMAREAR